MKSSRIILMAGICLAAVACSSPSKQMEQGQNIGVECTPTVLESIDGNIDASVKITFPEKYFKSNVILEIEPVLVYEGGEVSSEVLRYQGEKVKNNYPVVSSKGGSVNAAASFKFVEGMQQSHLEFRNTAVFGKDGKKRVALPTYKVADGVNNTYTLNQPIYSADFKLDEYQDTLHLHTDSEVKFEMSSAVINLTQENRDATHGYQKQLQELNKDERTILRSSTITSYASPEGGEEFNTRLTDHRAESAAERWKPMSQGIKVGKPSLESKGQDWEGFKTALEASNIEDKGLIIRVLSMYEDPETRETEIRNISSVYTELKQEVFPGLRRAEYRVNHDFVNYTTEELLAKKAAGETLDEISLLHVAADTKKLDEKIPYYKEALENYGSAVAAYDLAVIYVRKGDFDMAAKYVAKAADDADAANIRGAIAFAKGDRDAALELFAASGTPASVLNAGTVMISKGEYQAAAETLEGTGSYNEALANLLVGNLDKADAIAKPCCPAGAYLKAIVAARKGDAAKVAKMLEKVSENPSLKARAEKDIEFAAYR